jgi:hypothetical protein
VRRKTRANLGVGRLGGWSSRVDDDVHGRQVLLAVSERFAHEALQSIALDGVAGGLDADCKPEPGAAGIIGTSDDQEQRVRGTLALAMYCVELRLVGQSARARKGARGERAIVETRGNDQTARRLRPFARRRLSTRRPPLVAMRARKPWTRLRCRLLGLKVRFMFGSVVP